MACTDVANVKAKATAINLIILSSNNVNLQDLPPQTRLFKRTSLSREEKSREGQNIVTPKKGRPLNLGLIGGQKRFSRVCREGNTGT
jgi:hypothetical protein